MIHTLESLTAQLEQMPLKRTDTVLIHSSMKAIGQTEGGADTVLDALMAYFSRGLLLLPTHTWNQMGEDYPVFDPVTEEACVGILPNLFRKRKGVLRSLHPTHSMAAFGTGAADYIRGEERNNTPCTPGGCYDRLKDVGGKILLLGVNHTKNTYIHSVEEVLNVPHRLTDRPVEFLIRIPDGEGRSGTELKRVWMRRHFNAQQPDVSQEFQKLAQAFYDADAARKVKFGDAECILCDARGIFEVTRHVLAPDPECLVTSPEIPSERWADFHGGPYFV